MNLPIDFMQVACTGEALSAAGSETFRHIEVGRIEFLIYALAKATTDASEMEVLRTMYIT